MSGCQQFTLSLPVVPTLDNDGRLILHHSELLDLPSPCDCQHDQPGSLLRINSDEWK